MRVSHARSQLQHSGPAGQTLKTLPLGQLSGARAQAHALPSVHRTPPGPVSGQVSALGQPLFLPSQLPTLFM